MEVVDITKKDFEAYESVRTSGVTNMFAVRNVCDLSGLNREQVMVIMKNYSEYKEMFLGGENNGK